MRIEYPFSAVIGLDDLKLALQLVAVDPTIGGVLIKGERGTAKSTIARGLATLLPRNSAGEEASFVELPLGATEDRVVGSLDITRVLQDGQTQLRSGLLARADGGVLYVDEVNLLPDHLVDLLLDAAARGWVTVERDGVSAGEAARFVLIGTMNPEEGELRPQFLDRFGLSVQVRGLSSPELRMAAVAKRLAFDANPQAFLARAQSAEDALRQDIVSARRRLLDVEVTGEHLAAVANISIEHRLDGIRGDLAIIKAARALAAWQAVGQISSEHIRRAAEFALPHRSRRISPPRNRTPLSDRVDPELPPSVSFVGAPKLHSAPPAPEMGAVKLMTDVIDQDSVGRHGSDSTVGRRALRATVFNQTGTLAVTETLTVAAARGARAGEGGVPLSSSDLMQHDRRGSGHTSVLFLVDASSSMAAHRRMEMAKGAALGLLESSYQRRDEVALMVFRGAGTDLLLPFTNHVERIERALCDVPTGGRTPLARALLDATELLRTRTPAVLVLLTDGRANVSVSDTDPWEEALAACGALVSTCAGIVVVDCEPGPIVLERARVLAEALEAECIALDDLEAADLAVRIHRRLEAS